MTFPLILFLILVASCLFICRRRMAAWTLYGITAIVCFAVGCGWVPHVLLTHLQAPYAAAPQSLKWEKRNVIVLLGMGLEKITGIDAVEVNPLAYGRVARAASLYRSCKESAMTCKVIVSGGDVHGYGTSEAAVYGDYLMKLGVDADDLMPESKSLNTWQNAQFTSEMLRADALPFDRIWLVSSAAHLSRSVMYFMHFGMDVVPVRADYLSVAISPVPVAYNLTLTDIALHEYLGMWRTRLYNAFGWNTPPVRP